MAITVPTTQGPQLRTTAVNAPRVSTNVAADSFGVGQTEGITRALQGTTALVSKEIDRANEVAVLEADTKATRIKNSLFFDPQTGAMNKKGKDAFGAVGEYTQQWDKSAKDIEDSLSNPAQRSAFRARAEAHKNDLNGQLQKHAFMESQSFDNEQTEARLAVSRDEAVLNYNDPAVVAKNLEIQKVEIERHGTRNGLPPEKIQQMLADNGSKTHSMIIERMLTNGQDIDAENYVKANKDKFVAQDLTHVEKILEDGSLRGGSQRFTDDVMKRGLTMGQALEETKKIENPKLRDAASSRVREEFTMQKIAKEDQQNKIFDNVANIIEGTKGNKDNIPPKLWASLDLQQRNQIDARARQLREGTQPSTNWDKYYEFKSLASTPEMQNDFLRTNLMQHRSEFADPEFKELVNLQTAMRKGEGKEELDGYRTQSGIVKDSLEQAGIKNDKKVAFFQRKVDEEIIATQKRQGRKVSREETQSIVDNLLVEGVTKKGLIWDNTKRLYELDDGESITVRAKDIPRTDKLQIEKALRAKNIPVTEDNMVRLYTERHLTKKPGA